MIHVLRRKQAWRCRDCHQRFYLRPDGLVAATPEWSAWFERAVSRARPFRSFKRWWRNSWRWRSRNLLTWRRRFFVGIMLATAVALFLLLLLQMPAGE